MPWSSCVSDFHRTNRIGPGRTSSSSPTTAASTRLTCWFSRRRDSSWSRSRAVRASSLATRTPGRGSTMAARRWSTIRSSWPTRRPRSSPRCSQRQRAFGKLRVPFIEPLIFCSAENLQLQLQGNARFHVCLRDQANRPGIMAALKRRECPGLVGTAAWHLRPPDGQGRQPCARTDRHQALAAQPPRGRLRTAERH